MTIVTPQRTDLTIDNRMIPTLDDIASQHFALTPWVRRTPVFERNDLPSLEDTLVNFKFELLQASGSFKVRGAFTHLLPLDTAQRCAGVTCVSLGNYAVAVAYAAMRLEISAKVVLFRSANPIHIALCKQYRAEIVIANSRDEALEIVRRIEAEEGRYFVHSFDGYRTVLGAATLGYEWATQSPELDAVIVPVSSGGLAAGVSTALRLANPRVHVYGVESEGSGVMGRSFAAHRTVSIDRAHSIAGALLALETAQYSYELCRRHVDQIVAVSDDALRASMRMLFEQLKLAVEPACAAPMAGLLGPLREILQGKRVGVLLAGTNLDPVDSGEQPVLVTELAESA